MSGLQFFQKLKENKNNFLSEHCTLENVSGESFNWHLKSTVATTIWGGDIFLYIFKICLKTLKTIIISRGWGGGCIFNQSLPILFIYFAMRKRFSLKHTIIYGEASLTSFFLQMDKSSCNRKRF